MKHLLKNIISISNIGLLLVPLLLWIFSLNVYTPFEFKVFLIESQSRFQSLNAELEHKQILLSYLSDNVDALYLEQISDSYSTISNHLASNINFISTSKYKDLTLSQSYLIYYRNMQILIKTETNQYEYLQLYNEINSISANASQAIEATDNFDVVSQYIDQTSLELDKLQSKLVQIKPEPVNIVIQGHLQNYLDNQKAFYAKLSKIMSTVSTAIKTGDISSLRQAINEQTKLTSEIKQQNQTIVQQIIYDTKTLNEYFRDLNSGVARDKQLVLTEIENAKL